MKRILLVLSVLAFSVGSTLAAPISFGLKTGLAMSNFTGDDAKAYAQSSSTDTLASLKSKANLTGGLFLSFGVGGPWSIQAEALYVRKGTTIEATHYTGDISLDYINIPLFLKLSLLPVKGPVSPFLFFGPAVNINARAVVDDPQVDSIDIKQYVNSADFGLVFGAGIDIKKFTLDARYEMDFGNPIKAQGGYTPKIHNKTLYVLLGYKLF